MLVILSDLRTGEVAADVGAVETGVSRGVEVCDAMLVEK